MRTVVVLVLAVVAGGSAIAWHLTSGTDGTPAVARADDGSTPIPARPAPETPPEPVIAPGACGRAMDGVRAIQREFASGAILTDAANADLTRALARLDADCAGERELEREFRERELTPWLTYLPPGAGGS
jgi:hypothetical protein